MADEVNKLIQNAFGNPEQFQRFESSASGLTQDLARLNLGGNNHADKFLSDAEKDSLMKCFHLRTQITACRMRTKCFGKIDGTFCICRCEFYRLPSRKIGKEYVEMLKCEL